MEHASPAAAPTAFVALILLALLVCVLILVNKKNVHRPQNAALQTTKLSAYVHKVCKAIQKKSVDELNVWVTMTAKLTSSVLVEVVLTHAKAVMLAVKTLNVRPFIIQKIVFVRQDTLEILMLDVPRTKIIVSLTLVEKMRSVTILLALMSVIARLDVLAMPTVGVCVAARRQIRANLWTVACRPSVKFSLAR